MNRLSSVLVFGVAAGAAASASIPVLGAQIPAVKVDVRAARGQNVSPVYEGWYELDGNIYELFGYFNRNSEEVVDVAVGPNNKTEPGALDQGQPTRFFPGRQYGVFAVAVPKDRPKTEVTWTLTVHGQTLAIPATLDPLYLITPQKEGGGNYPGNTPPVLKFELAGRSAQGPAGMTITRSTTVSRPLALDVWVTDDGVPPPPAPARGGPSAPGAPPPVSRGVPQGLAVTWSVYRGPGTVTFSRPAPPIEQGKASTTATFSVPGDYTLRVAATDGSRSQALCCWTNGYVKVAVDRGGQSP